MELSDFIRKKPDSPKLKVENSEDFDKAFRQNREECRII